MFLQQRRLLMSTSVAALAAATVAVSDAETLAGSETDALAIVFTDDHFQATSGFYGSVYTVDSGTPANDYDNSPVTEASSYLTYTSPSVKNVLHADGELKYAAHNILTYSEDLTNAAWITNTDGAGVTVTGAYAAGPVGGSSADRLQLDKTGGTYARLYQTPSLAGVSGQTFRFSVWLRTTSGSGTANMHLRIGSNPENITVTGTWTQYTTTYTLNSTDNRAQFYVSDAESDDESVDILVYQSHLHRYPADTTYLKTTSAARYALPLEFDSSGTALGCLVEPQRTNLIAQYDFGSWTSASATVTSDAATSVTGETTAASVVVTGSGGHVRLDIAGLSDSTTYFVSLFAEANATNWVYVEFRDKAGTLNTCYFDVASGSVGTASGVSNTMVESYGNGRYRIGFSVGSATGVSTPRVLIKPTSADATNSANTDSAYLFGPQLELGSSASSLIETYGSTVTRAADNLSLATSAFPYSGTAGTIYVAGKTPKALVGDPILVELSSDANNRMDVFSYTAGSTYWFGRNGSGTQWGMALDAVGADTATKLAGAYASNDFRGCSDGNLGTADTSGAVPTCTTLYIGNARGGSQGGNYIEAILYLPRRVSDADMQTLTSTGALP